MRPIRIVLGSMPSLLRDIVVEVIANESDMSIVGGASAGGDEEELLEGSQADLLVCDDAGMAVHGGTNRLLREHERLKVLVLSERGRVAALHWLEPRTARCPDLSPDGLVGLIRTSFGGSALP